MTHKGLMMGAVAAIALAGVGGAQADTRAVYSSDDGEVVIEYRDRDNLRIQVPGGGFLLVTEGEAYSLARDDGKWFAISVDQIAEMTGKGKTLDVRMTALGSKEKIAGIVGEVYSVEEGDSWAGDWQEKGQVVLSSDARVRGLGQAFQRMGEMFGGMDARVDFAGSGDEELMRLGLLRSDDMVLQSVKNDALPDRNFSLPPNVQHRELPKQAMTRSAPGAEAADEPSWLGRQMQGTGKDVRDDSAGETNREVRERAREGLRNLFN